MRTRTTGAVHLLASSLGQDTAVRLLLVSALYVLRRLSGAPAAGAGRANPPARAIAAPPAARARSAGAGGSSLSGLPSAIHAHICSYLGATDLQSLALASVELREAATFPQLWRALLAARFGAVARFLGDEEALLRAGSAPWRLRYWQWERSWRQRVLATHRDIWSVRPVLLVHGRFFRVEKLLNEHPGGAELLGAAMQLGRDVGDIFDVAAHPPRARELLARLEATELSVPPEHRPLGAPAACRRASRSEV